MEPRKREDKRFHGAFTGGFSAGYYNTVGSKEGWAPKTFQSSRDGGGAPTTQRIEDFLDDEDDQLLGRRLELASKYDPNNAAQDATSKHLQQAQAHGASIPGFMPDDFIQPSRDSVGTKLLSSMGWKQGQGVGPKIRKSKLSRFDDDGDGDDIVYIAPKHNVDVAAFPTPKLDNYGVGYDPYIDAPEFAFLKRRQDAAKQASGVRQIMTFADAMKPSVGRSNMGHGLSALEENDDYDVYAIETQDSFDRELHDGASRKRLRAPTPADAKTHQVCSDGRPPLKGYVLRRMTPKPSKALLAPINVPPTYEPGRLFRPQRPSPPHLYSDHAFTLPKRGAPTSLTATQRGALLGEPVAKPALGEQVRAGMLAAMSSRFQSASSSSDVAAPRADEHKPLERATLPWKPDRLLCKRFRVQRPDEFVDGTKASALVDESQARFDREIVSHLKDADGFKAAPSVRHDDDALPELPPVVRPPEDLFKSIFDVDEQSEDDDGGSSSSSDDDEPTDEKREITASTSSSVVQQHHSSLVVAPATKNEASDDSSSSSSDDDDASTTRRRSHKAEKKRKHHKSKKEKKPKKKTKKHKKDSKRRRKD